MAWIDQLPSATATRAYSEHLAAASSGMFAGSSAIMQQLPESRGPKA